MNKKLLYVAVCIPTLLLVCLILKKRGANEFPQGVSVTGSGAVRVDGNVLRKTQAIWTNRDFSGLCHPFVSPSSWDGRKGRKT